jgi:hypothetical protein
LLFFVANSIVIHDFYSLETALLLRNEFGKSVRSPPAFPLGSWPAQFPHGVAINEKTPNGEVVFFYHLV